MINGWPLLSVQMVSGIWSIAGLLDIKAIVAVGPPLSVGLSPTRSGSVLFRLPVALNPHELSSEIL